MKKVYVINGPNLNMLGTREPQVYGKTTLRQIITMVKKEAARRGVKLKHYQSNHEGKLIDKIQTLAGKKYRGLIFNPGAFTHYSYALRDAVKASGIKTVEVHLSDISRREEFRRTSVIKDVCIAQVKGLGPRGYLKALEMLLEDKHPSPGES
ncbi:MAG: type II 3-dehydroquinate dehydratase [Spirochaetota bacterium]